MRKWLKNLVNNQYLPAIRNLSATSQGHAEAKTWAVWMKEQWADHGLKDLKQQRNLMTDVRNTIKHELGEDHFALETMNFTTAEWVQINEPIDDQVAARNENQQFITNPDLIVDRAAHLLFSREWAEVAAGLVVLTGRRSSEILSTATFEPKTPYSITFEGALKRRGEKQTLSFEIPTLAPAQQVITGLGKLRKWLPTEGLDAQSVNQKYGSPVIRACDRAFAELVPLRDGRYSLYTHLLRSVYATIATYWFCPPRVADIEFKAAIQGHFAVLDADNPQLRRSLASSRHYYDYKIADGNGNIDGRQGIKLAEVGVEVIEMFRQDKAQAMQPSTVPQDRKISTIRVYQDERDRLLEMVEKLAPEGMQPEKISTLLAWLEKQLENPPEPSIATAESIPDVQDSDTDIPPTDAPPEHSLPSSSMDQAWEKIASLTEVVTRLVTSLEGQALAKVPVASSSSKEPSSNSTNPTTPKEESFTKASDSEANEEIPTRQTGQSAIADAKVNYAIDEIIKHNSQPELPREEMWAITLSVLKTATNSWQGVIKRVMKSRKDEIEAHHQMYGLGKYHNNIHRGKDLSIVDIVNL